MTKKKSSNGVLIISALVILLIILHQDNWFWDSDALVLGFIPMGLFWHGCISLAASLVWALATVIAWPVDSAEASSSESSPAASSPIGEDQ